MERFLCQSIVACMMICGCGSDTASTPTQQPEGGWTLVWSDEFDGTSLDSLKWRCETGGGGWGNNEKEYYRRDNVYLSGGNLVIEAQREDFGGYHYTSARLNTAGLASWKYGRIEARMKLPYGQGIWPAFWMMGNSGDWPARGEIDIMEMIGGPGASMTGSGSDSKVYFSMHWADDVGSHVGTTGSYALPGTARFNDAYHDFSIEWDSTQVKWFVDSTMYFVHAVADPGMAAFQRPFFILLNLAVGGNWPGDPDAATVFPQYLLVDYVRVYRK